MYYMYLNVCIKLKPRMHILLKGEEGMQCLMSNIQTEAKDGNNALQCYNYIRYSCSLPYKYPVSILNMFCWGLRALLSFGAGVRPRHTSSKYQTPHTFQLIQSVVQSRLDPTLTPPTSIHQSEYSKSSHTGYQRFQTSSLQTPLWTKNFQ